MNMFHMQGPAVYRQASLVIEPFLERFLCALNWRRADVDTVVPHQASKHPIEQLSKRLGFRPEQVFLNLPLRGNCVSASIPLALAEAVESQRIRRGHRVLLFGTGAGLTLGVVALTY